MKWRKTKKAAKAACRRMRAAGNVEEFIGWSTAAAAADAAAEGMRRIAESFSRFGKAGLSAAEADRNLRAASNGMGRSVDDFRKAGGCGG